MYLSIYVVNNKPIKYGKHSVLALSTLNKVNYYNQRYENPL